MYAWYSVVAFLVALTFYNVRYAFMKVIGQCCCIFLLCCLFFSSRDCDMFLVLKSLHYNWTGPLTLRLVRRGH